MYDRCLTMSARESGLKLQDAAGIAGGDDVRPKLRHQFGFAIAEGFGGVRLHEIVDSCGTATDRGLGNFNEFEAGNT